MVGKCNHQIASRKGEMRSSCPLVWLFSWFYSPKRLNQRIVSNFRAGHLSQKGIALSEAFSELLGWLLSQKYWAARKGNGQFGDGVKLAVSIKGGFGQIFSHIVFQSMVCCSKGGQEIQQKCSKLVCRLTIDKWHKNSIEHIFLFFMKNLLILQQSCHHHHHCH